MATSRSVEQLLDGHEYMVIYHRCGYTAREEAANARIPTTQWAKAVACFADEQPILAVLPASSLVDFKRLRALTGAHEISLASESDFASLFPDCELGAVPPLGPIFGLQVFVDRSLAVNDVIVFNGGSHREAIELRYDDFIELAKPKVGDFVLRRD